METKSSAWRSHSSNHQCQVLKVCLRLHLFIASRIAIYDIREREYYNAQCHCKLVEFLAVASVKPPLTHHFCSMISTFLMISWLPRNLSFSVHAPGHWDQQRYLTESESFFRSRKVNARLKKEREYWRGYPLQACVRNRLLGKQCKSKLLS